MSQESPDIRIYSPFLPHPVTEGAFQVISDQARLLTGEWAVELVTWRDSPGEIARKLASAAGHPFPEGVRITSFHGGEVRSGHPAEWRRQAGPASAPRSAGLDRVRRVVRAMGSQWASPELFYYPPELDLRARLPVAALGIYHYSFAYSWLRRSGHPAEESACVHLHNLESELSRLRAGRGRPGPVALVHRANAAKLARHERVLGSVADELWFVSGRDRRALGESAGAPHRLVPPTFDPRLSERRRRAFLDRLAGDAEPAVRLGFIGSCDFEPNRASLAWIVRELAPALRRAGFRGRIQVAGRGVPAALRAAAEPREMFEWMGFVDDLEDFWSGLSFLLMPEVGGSGVRIKLLEALASGVPVLANPKATEALAPDLRAHPLLHVLTDPAEWAARLAAEPAPFATRLAVESADPPSAALDGRSTYLFLNERIPAAALTPAGAPAIPGPPRTARPPIDSPRALR